VQRWSCNVRIATGGGAPQFALKTDPATADYSAHVEVRMIGGRAAGRERHLDHGDYPVEGHG
jgi:hypothetical protein